MRSDWLDAFAVFAEHLNLTRAAQDLNLSQPALHAQIARLADEIGAPLYLRNGRQLTLTRVGEEVARFARQSHERRQVFMEELQEGRRHAPVILAAGQGAYLYILGEGLRHFHQHHDVPLRLQTLARGPCLQALHSGRCHLGVTVSDPTLNIPSITTQSLASFPTMLAVPRPHRWASRAFLRPEEVAEEPLILPPPGNPWRQQLERTFAAFPMKVGVEASGWPLMLHFVSLGLGVALVNGCCKLPPDLIGIPVTGIPQTHYVIIHLTGTLPKAVQALKETLLEHAIKASD